MHPPYHLADFEAQWRGRIYRTDSPRFGTGHSGSGWVNQSGGYNEVMVRWLGKPINCILIRRGPLFLIVSVQWHATSASHLIILHDVFCIDHFLYCTVLASVLMLPIMELFLSAPVVRSIATEWALHTCGFEQILRDFR